MTAAAAPLNSPLSTPASPASPLAEPQDARCIPGPSLFAADADEHATWLGCESAQPHLWQAPPPAAL